MAFVFRTAAAASCFAFVVFMGTGSIPSSEAADRDDHSYLPPWMLDQSGDTRKETVDPQNVPLTQGAQSAMTKQPAKTNEPNSADLTVKLTQTRSKVVGFVSNLFSAVHSFRRGRIAFAHA